MHLQRCKVAGHHRLVQLGSPKNGQNHFCWFHKMISQMAHPNSQCTLAVQSKLHHCSKFVGLFCYETDATNSFRWQHSFFEGHQAWGPANPLDFHRKSIFSDILWASNSSVFGGPEDQRETVVTSISGGWTWSTLFNIHLLDICSSVWYLIRYSESWKLERGWWARISNRQGTWGIIKELDTIFTDFHVEQKRSYSGAFCPTPCDCISVPAPIQSWKKYPGVN